MSQDSNNIEQFLENTSSRFAYHNQLKIARVQFDALCNVFYENGFFIACPELITYLTICAKAQVDRVVVLDSNEHPVVITDVEDFLDSIQSKYYQALNVYADAVNELRSSRKVKDIVGYED